MAFHFTDTNVTEQIKTGELVVIDFWATWCGPCMAMAPTIDKLAEEYEGKAIIGKYNIDEESDFSMKFRIMSIPTLLFFKGSEKPVARLTGAQDIATLRDKINSLL